MTKLPETIGQLTQIQHLDLTSNRLVDLPEWIGQLTQLRYLYLNSNNLHVLPNSISKLLCLERLVLGGNQLKILPQFIGRLPQLRMLYLWGNGLKDLPEAIGKNPQLELLSLESNQITKLPETIGRLSKLEKLYLNNNKLQELPESICQLSNLKELYLHNNDALGIPPEILGPEYTDIVLEPHKASKPADILAYYFRNLKESRRRLNEAKILIVGQGGVGKTSLVNRIVYDKFDKDEQRTEGINIARWQMPSKMADEQVRLNIWDFGGQEIMHATHQFFLTKRSLYIVVLDARKGENESNIHYWLKIIQSYGADAPVIVVVNKNEPPNQLELNETRLSKDYAPNLRGFFKVSCETGAGIAELKAAIEEHINALPHVYDQVPASYFAVKEKLEGQAKTKNFLDIKQYHSMCRTNGVTDERDQSILIRFLHDLGNVLNFDDPKDPYELRDTNILNPEWVTGGVYKILNNNPLMQAGGKLDISQLGAILNDPKCYPEERHKFIVNMMRKFELCFDFPDSEGQRLLIPELLPKNEPDIRWDEKKSLNFQYHYTVLPEGVLPRFIVKMHHLLTDKPTYWRSGVLLEIDGNVTMVRGDTQAGRVYISVSGPPKGRRSALAIIRNAFREIHNTIPKIGAQEKVPLPDNPDIVVDYKHLQRLEEFKTESFLPEGADKQYRVRDLLDGVDKDSFDVFLSHNSNDKPAVRELGEQLKAQGMSVWLDEWELQPGIPWQQELEEGIRACRSVAVLVGSDGIGPWENEEMRAALSLAVEDKRPVIPVLLPGAPRKPSLPLFLTSRTYVDLREGFTEAGLSKIVWGITGDKSRRKA
ncbi:MAG TPA: COR domain-containing protein [Abditibacteriaceae bacterium]